MSTHKKHKRMRAIKKEKGVLKLVHPGRHIEIHSEPIKAAEIMRRNPRHCITRPDVFEFPWIVVKPESLLLPGKVFFIVPNHTIYNLIKSKASLQNQQFSDSHSLQDLKQTSLVKHRQTHKQFTTCLPWKMYPRTQRTVQRHSPVEVWPKGIRNKDTQMKIEQQLHEESTAETGAYNAIEYRKRSEDDNGMESHENDVNFEFVFEQVTVLKSCVRKADSTRRFHDLKVSFDLPEEEEQRESNEVLQNFPGVETGYNDSSI